jgi:hypothetical protein
MPKPLELRIFPQTEGGHGLYIKGLGCADYHLDRTEKRLMDAELAAEVHAATTRIYRLKVASRGPGRPRKTEAEARKTEAEDRDNALDQMTTLTRFATHPHYDEESE